MISLLKNKINSNFISWINWYDFAIYPETIIKSLSHSLGQGFTLSLDIINETISGEGSSIYACPIPTCPECAFGTIGYSKLDGNLALELFNEYGITGTSTKVKFKNIIITDKNEAPIPNYTFLIVASELSNCNENINLESQNYTTNGSPWSVFDWFGKNWSPEVIGLSTNNIAVISYSNICGSPVLSTNTPTEITTTITSSTNLSSTAFGIYIPLTS